jgi:ATP-dependent Clp protease protease subunit
VSVVQTTSTGHIPPSAYKALFAGNIRFGHRLTENDYVVSQSMSTPITANTADKTLSALMQNAILKLSQLDFSNLKYSLHASESQGVHNVTAAADNLLLVGRPVDTFIQSDAGPRALFPLLTARMLNNGSRFYMSKEASIALGPYETFRGGTLHSQLTQREYANEFFRDLEALIQTTTGKTDRAQINRDINSARNLNALESLNYGKKGLVDAVLVGTDQVLSRAKLDEFYKSKHWDPETDQEKIAEFNAKPDSIDDIPKEFLTSLNEYNESSVAPDMTVAPLRRNAYQSATMMPPQPIMINHALNGQGISSVLIDKQNLNERIKSAPNLTGRTEYWLGALKDAPDLLNLLGVLYDDTIHFHTEFTEFSADKITHAIHVLSNKKQQAKATGVEPSNIKILVNSPGGYIHAAEEIRSAINQIEMPVDVIAQGMAASCGSYLLASATGNRLATPNARIMIHQGASGFYGNTKESDEHTDNLEANEKKYAQVIAKSSGRDVKEVRRDLKQDTWMNSLEAMFYGPKGLVDGILVASDKAVTKDDVLEYLKSDPDVQAFLAEKFGKKDAEANVNAYLNEHIKGLREPNEVHQAEKWEKLYGRDPLLNPQFTLQKLAEKAKPLSETKLKDSASRPQQTIDHFNVGLSDDMLGSLLPFLPSEQAQQLISQKK